MTQNPLPLIRAYHGARLPLRPDVRTGAALRRRIVLARLSPRTQLLRRR